MIGFWKWRLPGKNVFRHHFFRFQAFDFTILIHDAPAPSFMNGFIAFAAVLIHVPDYVSGRAEHAALLAGQRRHHSSSRYL
jgi:hypothetical protein